MRTGIPALVDDSHRISIGYETFFVSSDDAKRRFMQDVPKYCGVLTDPVTKTRFYPDDESPHRFHRDREYYFQSDSTEQVFAMMPMEYEDPAYKMLPKSDSTASVQG